MGRLFDFPTFFDGYTRRVLLGSWPVYEAVQVIHAALLSATIYYRCDPRIPLSQDGKPIARWFPELHCAFIHPDNQDAFWHEARKQALIPLPWYQMPTDLAEKVRRADPLGPPTKQLGEGQDNAIQD